MPLSYTCSILLDLPQERVAALWADEKHFNAWQDGFISIELLSGQKNEEGAVSKIEFEQGKHKMELIETMLKNDLPYMRKARYVHKHMTNTQETHFQTVGEEQTKFISIVEYTQFNGFLPKLMSILFKGVFKKQSEKWMRQFKVFDEAHHNANSH